MTISSATSMLVFRAVFSILICLVDCPEFISLNKASVGFKNVTSDFSFTVGSKILFSSFSIFASWNNGIFPLYFLYFLHF